MKTVAFFESTLNLRGTSIAMYDYAHYNEVLLGNRSIIISIWGNTHNALQKFQDRFPVFLVKNTLERDQVIAIEKVDVFYEIKYGNVVSDIPPPKGARVVNHAVFDTKTPHGDVFAGISQSLINADHSETTQIPCVPHMINLPTHITGNLREELQIPDDAIVFGYYGGNDSFNIEYVWSVIWDIVTQYKQYYFIFMNVWRCVGEHKQIITLPGTYDMERKVKFINTCDAMLHARSSGETFGLAVGEFSTMNKPIIVHGYYGKPSRIDSVWWCDNHLQILKDKAIIYNSKEELQSILLSFRSDPTIDYNAYRDYTPEKVMTKFQEVFLF